MVLILIMRRKFEDMKNIIWAAAVTLVSQFSLAQSKSVAAFTSLKVFDKIPVQLIPSSDYKAEISGSKSDDIEFVNSGNELKVRMKTLQLLQGDDVKVVLYYKNINSIQASQGAVITSADHIKASKLEVTSNEGSQIGSVTGLTRILRPKRYSSFLLIAFLSFAKSITSGRIILPLRCTTSPALL